MPYKSEKQRRFMHWKHSRIARRWDKEYGGHVEKSLAELGEIAKVRWVMPKSGTEVIRRGRQGIPANMPGVSPIDPVKFRFMEDPTGFRQIRHNQAGLNDNANRRRDWNTVIDRRANARKQSDAAYRALNTGNAPPETFGVAAGNDRLMDMLRHRDQVARRNRRDADLSDVSRRTFRNEAIPKAVATTAIGGAGGGWYGWGKYEQHKQAQRRKAAQNRQPNPEAEADKEQRNYVSSQYQQALAERQQPKRSRRLS